jgi:hypothetical protein
VVGFPPDQRQLLQGAGDCIIAGLTQ